MSDDIVTQELRDAAKRWDEGEEHGRDWQMLCHAASDLIAEIDRLRAENAKLRAYCEALNQMLRDHGYGQGDIDTVVEDMISSDPTANEPNDA